MNKLFRSIRVATLIFCICLLIVFPLTAFAEESLESVENAATQSEQVIEDNSSIIAEKDQQIEELIEQNNRNQKTIEDYRALYSTWTAVIGTLFVLFGIILPILITIGLDKWNKRDIKNEVEKCKRKAKSNMKD